MATLEFWECKNEYRFSEQRKAVAVKRKGLWVTERGNVHYYYIGE